VKELYYRLINTNATLHTYDVSEATAFSSGEHVNVVCVYTVWCRCFYDDWKVLLRTTEMFQVAPLSRNSMVQQKQIRPIRTKYF